MNWYVLFESQLVFIGNFGDYEAAEEVAIDLFGNDYTEIAEEATVKQWIQCVKETGMEAAA